MQGNCRTGCQQLLFACSIRAHGLVQTVHGCHTLCIGGSNMHITDEYIASHNTSRINICSAGCVARCAQHFGSRLKLRCQDIR